MLLLSLLVFLFQVLYMYLCLGTLQNTELTQGTFENFGTFSDRIIIITNFDDVLQAIITLYFKI